MSPSSYFMAADVVQDNIILVAHANSGAQAAVVINRDEWDTSKQVMIQTRLPGDTCLTMYCDLCEPNGTTWDNLQSMLSLLLVSTSGLPLPMGYQWTTYRA